MTYQPHNLPEPMASPTTYCPECAQPLSPENPGHWVNETASTRGFWTCEKFYGPDGKRIDAGSIIKSPLEILEGLTNAKA